MRKPETVPEPRDLYLLLGLVLGLGAILGCGDSGVEPNTPPSYSQTVSVVNDVDIQYSAALTDVSEAFLAYLRENGDTVATRTITTPTYIERFADAHKGSNVFILSAPGLAQDTVTATVSQYLPTIDLEGIVTGFEEGDSLTIDLQGRVIDINPEDNPVPIISATPLRGDVETTLIGYQLGVKANSNGAYEVEIEAGSDEGGINTRTLSGYVVCGATAVNDKIAFLRLETQAFGDDPFNRDIFVMDRDGSNQVNLTNEPGDYYSLAFSPGGKWIGFLKGTNGFVTDVFVMSPDGACVRNLTSHPAGDRNFQFAPDGSKMVFQSDRDTHNQIYVVNVDGSGLTNLTNSPEHDRVPTWSPDGTKIAFVRSDELYIMNSDGSNQRPLSTSSLINPVSVRSTWSHDGTTIAFVQMGNDEVSPTNDIYVINADGTGLRRVTAGFQPTELEWSPRSNDLLFNSAWDGLQDFYVIHDFGEVGERLERFRIPQTDFDARWSPDGKEFAFVSAVFDSWEIVRLEPNWDDLSLSVFTRLTTNLFSDHQPRWSR
jgi:Tol biopolymer transport system component